MDFVKTHARTGDPETSKAAAKAAKNFYKTHCGQIFAVLVRYGPQTVDEIAQNAGMSSQQVNKRLPNLLKMGRAVVDGEGTSSAGVRCRIWRAL